ARHATGTPWRSLAALFRLALGLLALCAVPHAARAAGSGRDWVHVRLEGPLETGMLVYLERALDEARARGGGLLLEIDTPGGEIELMWRLATALADASDGGVRTAAWVNDRALSAGALLG